MQSTTSSNVCQILERINRDFDFLFRRGFRITSILFAGQRDEQWQILLTEGNYLVQFHGCEDRIDLSLSSPALQDEVGYLELSDLIDLVENEGAGSSTPDAFHDSGRMAGLLRKHIDEILILMDRMQHVISMIKARTVVQINCPGFLVL